MILWNWLEVFAKLSFATGIISYSVKSFLCYYCITIILYGIVRIINIISDNV
uniref:Uncharacterized protein n=1 Tax=Brugia malayi TaxID=6279 RepID=A8PCS7_BRUMA